MSRQKQPQILEIEPMNEIRFKGPFTDVVTSHLKLTNPSDKRVCFKVKTTAPRRYCVRPNSGFVDPSGNVNVSVMLQPMDSDTQDKGKHKFMVQSMFAPDVVDDVDKLWGSASPTDLMDSKLRCVFEEPEKVAEEAVTTPLKVEPPVKAEAFQPTMVKSETNNESKAELHSIMEECKRLQSQNAKLKQAYDEIKAKMSPGVNSSGDALKQQKQQFQLFIILAFVLGLLLGYILL
ncbi:vesicle-associated membrane protein-associated protein B-like [Ciona intestinalis]